MFRLNNSTKEEIGYLSVFTKQKQVATY